MKLLLDTHIFLWSLVEPSRLSRRVAAELDTPSNELWLSPVVVWEVLILAEKARVVLHPDPVTWIGNVLRAVPFTEASLSHEIAIRSRAIDLPHQDPVDRFLAATALAYDLTLVTADERLLQCTMIATLPNR